MLKRVDGNLIQMTKDGMFDIVVHGCNCQNVMGAGIAKQLATEWPGILAADNKASQIWSEPIGKLGNFSTYLTQHIDFDEKKTSPLLFINAYTQIGYGRGRDNFEYESFQLILRKLEIFDVEGNKRFGFPYIGMGLAGGDERRIIPMIEDFATRHDTTLVKYAPYK